MLDCFGRIFRTTRFKVCFAVLLTPPRDSFPATVSVASVMWEGRGVCVSKFKWPSTASLQAGTGPERPDLVVCLRQPPPPRVGGGGKARHGWQESKHGAGRAPAEDATKASMAVRTFLPARVLRQSQCLYAARTTKPHINHSILLCHACTGDAGHRRRRTFKPYVNMRGANSRARPRKEQTCPRVKSCKNQPPSPLPVKMPRGAFFHTEIPGTHVHRDYAGSGALTHPSHAGQIPNLGISAGRCAALESKLPSMCEQSFAKLGRQISMVSQQLICSRAVPRRQGEAPSPLIQKLEITERGAR